MSAIIQLNFGSLLLDDTNDITIGKISEKASKPIQTNSIPVTDGAIAETAKLGPKTINVEGDIGARITYISNGGFEIWSAGTAVAPTGWTLAGAGASVARESTIIKIGSYSAKITRVGAQTGLYQDISISKGIAYWKGKTVTLSCWVYATVANRARIVVSDQVDITYSSYHTGNSLWQLLTVTHTISSSATAVNCYCALIDNGDTTVYADGASMTCAEIAASSYDDLRTNLDALHAGLLNGLQKLNKDNERYIYCQLKDFSYAYDHMTRRATWSASFVAHFPFWLAETASTDSRTPTSGVGYTINNAGNAPARIKFQITPTGSMADACKIENTTTGKTFQFRGTVGANNTLEIDNRYDTDDFEVLNNGVDAHTNFEGDFLTLNPGDNTIKFTGTASTAVLMTWRKTWY